MCRPLTMIAILVAVSLCGHSAHAGNTPKRLFTSVLEEGLLPGQLTYELSRSGELMISYGKRQYTAARLLKGLGFSADYVNILPYWADRNDESVELENEKSKALYLAAIPANQQQVCKAVVWFHGNGMDAGETMVSVLKKVVNAYDMNKNTPTLVITAEYPGYGMMEDVAGKGKNTMNSVALSILRAVQNDWGIDPANTMVGAWSIGTGILTKALSTRYSEDGVEYNRLLLQSPYRDISSLVTDLSVQTTHVLPQNVASALVNSLVTGDRDYWNTAKNIRNIGSNIPVMIMHGDKDPIISISNGKAIRDSLDEARSKNPTVFCGLKGVGHDVMHKIASCPSIAKKLKGFGNITPKSTTTVCPTIDQGTNSENLIVSENLETLPGNFAIGKAMKNLRLGDVKDRLDK